MSTPIFRWGILGTAHIAHKNWQAIRNSGNGVVAAVASREVERSRRFIAECQAAVPFDAEPRALGRYEDLIAAPDIDAVYVPLPTMLRKEWVLRAAAAGKHVVCEKPCAASAEDLEEMLAACRKHQVQFMDGVMFMHSRRLDQVRAALNDSQRIGPIRRISLGFCFNAPAEFFTSNIRARTDLEPQGCLGDLGWYCLRFTLWTMNWKMPHAVAGRILSPPACGPAQAPTEFSAELFFSDGASAGFYCSFVTAPQEWVKISGTAGYLEMSDFVLPFYGREIEFDTWNHNYQVRVCDFRMDPHRRSSIVEEHSHGHPNSQESNLFRNFAQQVQSGQINDAWPDQALKTQILMDTCLSSARAGGKMMELAT